jgi:hypothetical protein
MPRLAVVFDANIYRNYNKGAFSALQARESQHSVLGHASFWTCMELLAHLSDPADPAFSPSWQAIHRLMAHCTEFDGSRLMVRFIADGESQLCRTLFGKVLPGRDEQAVRYGELLGSVRDARTIDDLVPLRSTLLDIRTHVLDTERDFAQLVFSHVVQALVPDATSWDALVKERRIGQALASRISEPAAAVAAGSLFAVRAASQLGIVLSAPEIRTYGEMVAEVFGAPVSFYLEVVRRIAIGGNNMNIPRNANSVWDLQFAFSSSPRARMGHMPIWAVSRDDLVLYGASAAGASKWFLHPEAYEAAVSLPSADFNELVASTTP